MKKIRLGYGCQNTNFHSHILYNEAITHFLWVLSEAKYLMQLTYGGSIT